MGSLFKNDHPLASVTIIFLTQRTADAGHTVEEGLAGPLHVESHPVPEAAHEADV